MIGRPPSPRRPDSVQALQDCLAQMETGFDCMADLVDGDAVLVDELVPLLRVVEALKQHRTVPSSAFRRRAGLALARVDMPQRGAFWATWWLGFRLRAGALRLAAVLATIALALGGLTVAQASRNPDGWAGRTLAQAWRAARILPGLRGSPTFELPTQRASDPLQPPPQDPKRPIASASRRSGSDGQVASQSVAVPVATPGVQLGRKPRVPGPAGVFAVPTASATSATPLLAAAKAPTTAPPAQAAASPSSATPADGSTRLTPASVMAVATAPSGSPPTAASPPGRALVASLSGRVILQSGRPIVNLPVTVFRHDAEGNARWWDAVATTRTDADGRYQLRDLSPGSYKVMAGYAFLFAPRRWYPSAARSAEGQAVVLAGGQARDDVDLRFGEEAAAPLLIWALLGR